MKTLTMNDRLPFGQYGPGSARGAQLVSTVIREDPEYMDWWNDTIEDYPLDEEAQAELERQIWV